MAQYGSLTPQPGTLCRQPRPRGVPLYIGWGFSSPDFGWGAHLHPRCVRRADSGPPRPLYRLPHHRGWGSWHRPLQITLPGLQGTLFCSFFFPFFLLWPSRPITATGQNYAIQIFLSESHNILRGHLIYSTSPARGPSAIGLGRVFVY